MVTTSLILIAAIGVGPGNWLDASAADVANSEKLDGVAIEGYQPFEIVTAEPTRSSFLLRAGREWSSHSLPLLVTPPGYYNANIAVGQSYFRIERDLALSDGVHISVQGSLEQGILTDLSSDAVDGLTDWPQMKGRAAFTLKVESRRKSSWTCRLTSAFDFSEGSPPPLDVPPESDVCFAASSVSIDLRLPVSDRSGFGAHYYTGINLSPLLDRLGQDVWFSLPQPVRSTGGRCEVWFDWTPQCRSNFGVGIEDPGHQAGYELVFTNLRIDLTDRLKIGFDVARRARFDDNRVGEIPIDALLSERDCLLTIDWIVQYDF